MRKIGNIKDNILKPIIENKTLFLIVLLMSYTIGLVGNMIGARNDVFLNLLLNISDSYLICIVAFIIEHTLKRYKNIACAVKYVFCTLTIFVIFVELFVLFFCHSLVSVHIMMLLAETNGSESTEFIALALSSTALWTSIVILVVISSLSFVISRKYRLILGPKTQMVLEYIFLIITLWSVVRQISTYAELYQCFHFKSAMYCAKEKDVIHLNTPTTRVLFGLAFNNATASELTALEEAVENTQVDSCSHRCPLIVLIIGESYNKHHSHLYNNTYLEDTPYLDKLEVNGSLIKYTDAITPYNLTSHVFKYMFSMYDEQKTKETNISDSWSSHSLFTALFKKAGYNVFFATNQFVMSSNDDWDAMGSTFINNRRLSGMQFTWRNTEKYTFDGQIVDALPSVRSLTEHPTLLIIHLIGQHVDYQERYPKEFGRFKPSDARTTFGGAAGRQTEADYANATLYNDYVINKIFDRFRNTDAICIYVSDHGEEVYDWRDAYDRTQERPIPTEVMRYQYEIPMMFLVTDTFKKLHSDIVNRIVAKKDVPVLNTNLSHTIVWLGGINTPEYNAKIDVLSNKYNKQQKRTLWGETYYKK